MSVVHQPECQLATLALRRRAHRVRHACSGRSFAEP